MAKIYFSHEITKLLDMFLIKILFSYHCRSLKVLLQSHLIIILKPICQSLLKAPLKLITTIFQLLATDIRRNLKLFDTSRTNPHRSTQGTYYTSYRHNHPVRNIRNKLYQARYFLHSLYRYRLAQSNSCIVLPHAHDVLGNTA